MIIEITKKEAAIISLVLNTCKVVADNEYKNDLEKLLIKINKIAN